MQTFYFDLKHAIEVHDKIINLSGGKHGQKDIGLLESILTHIQNDSYYPEFLDKITHLTFQVNKSHAFIDGNKRTSIALSAYLLELNGYDYCVVDFIRKMETVAPLVAQNYVKKDLIKRLIQDVIFMETNEENEGELMLALAKSLKDAEE